MDQLKYRYGVLVERLYTAGNGQQGRRLDVGKPAALLSMFFATYLVADRHELVTG